LSAARLKITVLGCGPSTGVPRVGNIWSNCDPSNPKNRRRRASILVERIGAHGVTAVLIDTGPDARQQMLDANIEKLDGVLYTHAHADHLHGIDDLRALFINSGNRVAVYSDAATLDKIEQSFSYVLQPIAGGLYPAVLDHHLIQADQPVEINGEGGPLTVWPVLQVHGDIHSLGFRFGSFLYSSDINAVPEVSEWHFEFVETWMLDALRYKPHPSHYSISDAIEAARIRGVKNSILTHMHGDLDYDTVMTATEPSVIPAFDMMTFEIEYSI
jgi:phosphoribosyl 1,2-cyclic phosphate phosphodiesterase